MTVRTNCEYALRQAHASGSSRYYWIDAICINQESTQEKNHQVAMMGRIYAKASHVLACVGRHSDGSELLLSTIAKYKRLLGDIHKRITIPELGGRRGWHIPNPIPTTRWLSLKCFFVIDAKGREEFSEAVIAFLRRPYFTRLWVLQELHLASSSSICCGMDSILFDQLLAASLLIDFWINQKDYIPCWRWPTRKVVCFLGRRANILRRQKSCTALSGTFIDLQPQRGCLALASGARGPRRLADVLDEMQYFRCADIRDKLYGILSLVEWGTCKRPEPDYAKDSFEVCAMVLKLYLGDDMLAPTTGTYIDWALRLLEVFEISPELGAMRQSLEARCTSSLLPDIFRTSCGIVPVQDDIVSLSRHGSRASISSIQTVKQKSKRRYRNMWYGVRLHYAEGPVSSWSSAPQDPSYLYCDQRPSRTRTVTGEVVEIVDARGRLVAFAPWDTQASDWFLASASSSRPTKDSIGMVLRLKDFSTRRFRHTPHGSFIESRPYRILGQAALHGEPEGDVFSLLDWEYFQPRWDAEDLLVLQWTFFQSIVRDINREDVAHWLSVRVCKTEGSSDVNGPVPPDETLPARRSYTHPVKYIHRPMDPQLTTPEAAQFFPVADLLEYSDVLDEENL